MYAVADHPAVIGVLLQPGGTGAGHIKIDDIDVIPEVPGNFTGYGPGDLRPPFHVRNVGNASGRRAAGGDGHLRRAQHVIPRSVVGDNVMCGDLTTAYIYVV